jgi:uncharacterized membrane protein (Fun14 family)
MEKTLSVLLVLLVSRGDALAGVTGAARARPAVVSARTTHAVRSLQDEERGPTDGSRAAGRAAVPARNSAYIRAKQGARAAAYREQQAIQEWTVTTERESAPLDVVAPEVTSGGVSGVLGFCSGKACRVASDAAALGVGAAFVFVTLLSRAGYVTINYTKVERDLLSLLDLNQGEPVHSRPPRPLPCNSRPLSCHPNAYHPIEPYPLPLLRSHVMRRGLQTGNSIATTTCLHRSERSRYYQTIA